MIDDCSLLVRLWLAYLLTYHKCPVELSFSMRFRIVTR